MTGSLGIGAFSTAPPPPPEDVEIHTTSNEKTSLHTLPEKTTETFAGLSNTTPEQQLGAALIANGHGAPAIGAVMAPFSPVEMTLILQGLKIKTEDAQLRTVKEGLGITRQKLAQEHKNSLEKLTESIKKSESAESKSKVSKIFGWVAKVGAVVGSLVAIAGLVGVTGLTGGAAAPLLALAVIGLVGATISLTSAIVQAAGGPPVDINSAMTWGCKAVLKIVGVPEEKLEGASKIMAGALGMVTGAVLLDSQLVGSLAAGIVELTSDSSNWAAIIGATVAAVASVAIAVVMACATGGAGAGEAVKEILQAVPQVAKVAQAAIAGVSAGGTLVTAGMNIDVSFDEHASAVAQVDRQKFSAVIAKLQALMETDTEQITKIVKEMQESIAAVSKMIAAAGESRSQIAANIGHSMA